MSKDQFSMASNGCLYLVNPSEAWWRVGQYKLTLYHVDGDIAIYKPITRMFCRDLKGIEDWQCLLIFCMWILYVRSNAALELMSLHISSRGWYCTSHLNSLMAKFYSHLIVTVLLKEEWFKTSGIAYSWVNYNDLTATSLESWFIREIIPKWP